MLRLARHSERAEAREKVKRGDMAYERLQAEKRSRDEKQRVWFVDAWTGSRNDCLFTCGGNMTAANQSENSGLEIEVCGKTKTMTKTSQRKNEL